MKNKYHLFLTLGFALAFGALGWGQPQPGGVNAPATNDPAVKVEETDVSAKEPVVFVDEDEPKREVVVSIGHDVELKAGDTARAVVVIGGSAKIHGKVRESVVVIGGDIEIDGEVRHAVVAVLGDIHAKKGANLHEEAISVGGRIESTDDTHIGRINEVDFGPLGKGLRQWVIQCVFKLRPLAPQVGWVWAVWAVFFIVYLLVFLILPTPVMACAAELTRRPATTFFMGLLTKILLPLVLAILGLTVIGAFVIPFVLAALLFGAIVGKVALFEFIGGGLSRRFGTGFLQNSLIAFLMGVIVVTLLYMVPLLGLIAFGVVSVWGLGGAVTAAFWGLKKEIPDKQEIPTMPTGNISPASLTGSETGAGSLTGDATNPSAQVLSAQGQPVGAIPEAYSYPRAGFWPRMGAAFLDLVLVGIIAGVLQKPQFGLLAALAYFSGMWAWKGTTVGGVVLGLKVVRIDGYPVTLLVSIVRGLAAAFSVVVFFLGFLWIIFDREKQGWHDKIAGTVVVKLPKGTPLVML